MSHSARITDIYRFLLQVSGYLLSAALGRIGVVFSVFVYSYFISPHDMGLYNVFYSYIWIVAILVSINIHTGFGRYIYDSDLIKGELLATCLLFMLFVSPVILSLFWGISKVADSPFSGQEVIAIFMILVGIGNVAEAIVTQISAYSEDSWYLLKIMLVRSIVSVVLTILLLWSTSLGYMAIIIGDVVASVLTLSCLISVRKLPIRWVFRVDYLKLLLKYSIPILPYMLALAILSQFNRVIVEHFFGAEQAGLYSLAYNFGILPMLAATAVVNASNRRFFESLQREDFPALRAQVDFTFWIASLASAVLVVFGEPLARWILPDAYSSGFYIVPIVGCAGLLFTHFQLWVRALAFRDHPGLISLMTVLGAIINLALNMTLLPDLGPGFAAWATVIAYGLLSAACIMLAAQTVGIPWPDALRALRQLAIVAIPAIVLALDLSQFAAWLLQLLWFALIVVLALRAMMDHSISAQSPANGS